MPVGVSPASSLSLKTKDKNLVLNARMLPYRPIKVGGKQRAEFTWYAGSPVATVQVLGTEEDAIELQGFWKERFLDSTSALIGGTPIASVIDLVDTVDNLRRTGQQVQFTWGHLTRYGIITEFEQTWHNPYDCEWSLTFAPISIEPVVTQTSSPNKPDMAQALAASEAAIADWSGSRIPLTGPNISLSLAGLYEELDDYLTEVQGALTGAVEGSIGGFFSNIDTVRQMGSALARATGQLSAFAHSTLQQSQDVLMDTASLADTLTLGQVDVLAGDPEAVSIASKLQARLFRCSQAKATTELRDTLIEEIGPVVQSLAPPLVATFLANGEMDLRDVSTRFYGTPDQWRFLKDYNLLPSSKLEAGDLIWVPAQADSAASASSNSPRPK
jgi:hypothetical protein